MKSYPFTRKIIVAGVLLFSGLVLAAPAPAPEKTKSFKSDWAEPGYALCEGIGVHGTYRAYFEAEGSIVPDGSNTVKHVAVWIGSAAVSMGTPSLGVKLEVRRGTTVLKSVLLTRPTTPSVEASPSTYETNRLYLRGADVPLRIPKDCELLVIVSPVINRPEGACALSTSRKTLKVGF